MEQWLGEELWPRKPSTSFSSLNVEATQDGRGLVELPEVLLRECLLASISCPYDALQVSAVCKKVLAAFHKVEAELWYGMHRIALGAVERLVEDRVLGPCDPVRERKRRLAACWNPRSLKMLPMTAGSNRIDVWRQATCRSGHCACLLPGNLMLVGFGLTNTGLVEDHFYMPIFDLECCRWLIPHEEVVCIGPMPAPRLRASLTACGKGTGPFAAVLFGGIAQVGQPTGDAWGLTVTGSLRHPSKGTRLELHWLPITATGEPLKARAYHAACALDGGSSIAFLGGTGHGQHVFGCELELLEGLGLPQKLSLSWQRPEQFGLFPPPMTQHLAATLDDPISGRTRRLFVVGGICHSATFGERFQGPATVFMMELADRLWYRLPPDELGPQLTSRMAGCTMGPSGRWLLVYGGDQGGRTLSSAHLLDMEKRTWRRPQVQRNEPDPDGDLEGPPRPVKLASAGHSLCAGVLLGGYDLDRIGRMIGASARLELITVDPEVPEADREARPWRSMARILPRLFRRPELP